MRHLQTLSIDFATFVSFVSHLILSCSISISEKHYSYMECSAGCDAVPTWDGLRPDTSDRLFGVVVSYRCTEGQRFINTDEKVTNLTSTCVEPGLWNPPLKQCEGYKCSLFTYVLSVNATGYVRNIQQQQAVQRASVETLIHCLISHITA